MSVWGVILGSEPRTLHMLVKCSNTELHPLSFLLFQNVFYFEAAMLPRLVLSLPFSCLGLLTFWVPGTQVWDTWPSQTEFFHSHSPTAFTLNLCGEVQTQLYENKTKHVLKLSIFMLLEYIFHFYQIWNFRF